MKALLIFVTAMLAGHLTAAQYGVGQEVEVYSEPDKKWFKSTILKAEGKSYFIHFKGYDDQYDTWAQPTHIRKVGEKKVFPIVYLIASNEKLYTYYVQDKAEILHLTPDSSVVLLAGDTYHFKKQTGHDFQTAKEKIYESRLYLEYVDENSFMISRSHDNLTYYHADKQVGSRIINSGELSKTVDSALVHIKKMEAGIWQNETKKAADAEFKAVTNFVRAFTTKRNDPALVNDVTKWWNGDGVVVNPLLSVQIVNPDYSVRRNDYGVILNKYITVLLVYKMGNDGKCYARTQTVGYDNTGGSTYGTQLKAYSHITETNVKAEHVNMYPGKGFVMDCAAISRAK